MAAKTKAAQALSSGMHTAGIFSDMTVDGPVIGTLVLVVDRAKNLPNRKSIGKQDPYCAARLGKEAKKTNTDIRGGQTPRWDQELRFTVHDSPDYFQLKISLFNDDKKTELIGETWVDLQTIIVPGGGQNDLWHQLSCRGKYAGDIRIEITYYDSRPKPEKPVVRAKASGSLVDVEGQARPLPKRRPLPSDPVTGKAPPSLASSAPPTPEYAQTPPRPLSGTPLSGTPTSFVATPSPLQLVGYQSTPDPFSGQGFATPERQDRYSQHVPPERGYAPEYQQILPPRREFYDDVPHEPHGRQDYNQARLQDAYDGQHQYHDMGPTDEGMAGPDDLPPPPPAHRSRNNSGSVVHASEYDVNGTRATPPTMRHDVLRNEAHRRTLPASYPGRPSYKPYDSAPAMTQASQYEPHQPPPPRHHSYDPNFDLHRSMQPTVEDVTETTDAMQYMTGNRRSRMMPFEPDHGSPLTLDHYQGQAFRKEVPSSRKALPYRREDGMNGFAPPVPASLVPGMDPSIAHEIAERFHEDRHHRRRYTQPPPVETPWRGRAGSEEPPHFLPDSSPGPYHDPRYDPHSRSRVACSSGPSTPQDRRPRTLPPMPMPLHEASSDHNIKRKSVSPAPPPQPLDDSMRRLSGVPFGPDSYDALNPSVVAPQAPPVVTRHEYHEVNGKIITHDGREVDPSDHLPMETWAPEPEPVKPKRAGVTPSPPSSAAGAQPQPPSGRRQLRVAIRPQKAVTYDSVADHPMPSPPSAGRNRLQKKPHPSRPNYTVRSTAATNAPLTPGGSPNNYHAPARGSPSVPYGGSGGRPPVVPAKIALALPSPDRPSLTSTEPMMSGALGHGEWRGPGAGEMGGRGQLSLVEEMQSIDIGTGRARRHGHARSYGGQGY